VLERRKSELSLLRDFEDAGELVICKEFGEDVADIAQLAQRLDENGLLEAVALDRRRLHGIVVGRL
jgi:phage terminase large subunit-like protein